ncbi:MAG: AAA family ATPase [Candidatus Gracilibacteria bacterium]
MIIGLTGPMASGKGEVVEIFKKLGFSHITLSSMVREEAKRRNIPEERERLMEVGNSMRAKEGPGVLAKRALEKAQSTAPDGNWVIDGIRNPAEIEALHSTADVYVIGISTPREMLIERLLSRARAGDAISREEIATKLDREWGKNEPPEGQQVGLCMQKVDRVVPNEGTLDALEKNILSYYHSLLKS